MDFFAAVEDRLARIPPAADWPELRGVLQRASHSRPRAWQLPVSACLAVGGTTAEALPVAAAVAALQISIILIDDLLDDDPRGEHRHLGGPAAANLAAAFQALALSAAGPFLAAPARLAALDHLNAMVLTTAWGQHLDTQNPADEAGYWALVRTKSAPFFGAALEAGALFGGAEPELAVEVCALGGLYGEMVQIHDDLQDVMATPANPDWLQGRSPLPVLFARNVPHPERARFEALRASASMSGCLAEAQAILIRCGAVSYVVHELLARHEAAQAHINRLPLADPSSLRRMFTEAVEPVRQLAVRFGAPELPGCDLGGWARGSTPPDRWH